MNKSRTVHIMVHEAQATAQFWTEWYLEAYEISVITDGLQWFLNDNSDADPQAFGTRREALRAFADAVAFQIMLDQDDD